ncbi:MAG: F0F1 ATP synthase subunit delta [Halanaerobiaceae bacterium]|nr:F0F1 ATP synthase subunit delta [Halanaerobiaceae bacterium]
MRQNEIAKKYSLALFELGKEENKLTEFREQLEIITNTIEENTDLKKMLFHPLITPEDKKKILQELFSSAVSDEILNFLKILLEKRREKYIRAILNDFTALMNKENGILEVEVISAVELSAELKDKLEQKLINLSGYKIILKERVSPDIIGGLILKIGDQVIDGSIRHDLELLMDRIIEIPVSELGV